MLLVLFTMHTLHHHYQVVLFPVLTLVSTILQVYNGRDGAALSVRSVLLLLMPPPPWSPVSQYNTPCSR
jgi:hypothetical protein